MGRPLVWRAASPTPPSTPRRAPGLERASGSFSPSRSPLPPPPPPPPPRPPLHRSNRSAAFLQLSKVQKALADAETVVSLKPTWEKVGVRGEGGRYKF